MPNVRLWAICLPATVPTAQAALDALASADLTASFTGRFPAASPVVHYAGWQGDTPRVAQVRATLAPVPGVVLATGPVYGQEDDGSPGVAQESDITAGSEPSGNAKHARRAAMKKAFKALGLGLTVPPDLTAPGAGSRST